MGNFSIFDIEQIIEKICPIVVLCVAASLSKSEEGPQGFTRSQKTVNLKGSGLNYVAPQKITIINLVVYVVATLSPLHLKGT